MPLASDDLARDFHETNGCLRRWLQSLPTPVPGSVRPAVSPEQMAGLLSELLRAGARLRSLPAQRDARLDQELSEYRMQVQQLHALLPSIHTALLRERARLEQERHRLASAAAWAEGSRRTL